MSQKTESIITYFVFAIIIFGSVFGLAYPLMNPTAYAELMLMSPTAGIPLVDLGQPMTCTYPMGAETLVDSTTTACENILAV